MTDQNRTPQKGLELTESLYQKHPNNQWIRNNLVRYYIEFGFHHKATELIEQFYCQKTDVASLKFQAWLAHQKKDFNQEQSLWNKITQKSYYAEYDGILGNMFYQVEKPIELNANDIPLFCVQRNELLRLPCFLEYYRKLGVTKFFFTDNNSDDGSFEYLLAQPDCYVFWTKSSHNQAGAGMAWNQYLIQKYVKENQWYLVIDADELFVYPECETLLLPQFIQYLDKCNYDAVASYVLDMFPKNEQEQLNIKSGDNLLEKSPYFYNHYIFDHQIGSPYHKVRGGIFHVFGQNIPINVTPLLKKRDPYIKLLSSRHLTTPTKISDVTSCLLHFKFIGDFYQKSLDETKRKQHWGGGIAYKRYMQFFENTIKGDFNFTDLEKTTKYKNSHQLVELGLIKTSTNWQNFTHNLKRTPTHGLKILEKFHHNMPNNWQVTQRLINAHIKLGHHQKALSIIEKTNIIKDDRINAWIAHQNGEIDKERAIWNNMLDKGAYYLQTQSKINQFIPKSEEKLTLTQTDIPLFCVQRNEMTRLPIFLNYYRNLGVTKFIFVDNNSDDGSFEYLIQQSDCYVYWTDDSYNQSVHGLLWLNYLVNETDILHLNQWYLIADVDELLVYSDYENRKLTELIDYLNQEQSETVASFMLDMYADNLLGYNDTNFINEHIYFYNHYQIFYQAESPYIKMAGGIRNHLFSEYNDYIVKTALFKKIATKSYLLSSTHQTTPYKISKLTTALKHYKFVDLKEIAKKEIHRKQHSGGGSRYRHYHNHLENNENAINLLNLPKTTKYKNSQQLVELGLINSPDEWIFFIKNKDIIKTPKYAVEILEKLQKKHPNNHQIQRSLIDAYMHLRDDKKLHQLLQSINSKKTDTYHLKLKSWQAHQAGNLITQKQYWNDILRKNYLASVHAPVGNLIKISKQSINIQQNDIVLFTHIYNEMLRVPNLLKYYRSLGVSQFFVIDNNSTDNCQEFLLQQPDVHLFWTNENHTLSGEGMVWYQYLIETYLKGNWILVVDADEFLVYPNCETKKLQELTAFLDKYDYEAMTSFMLDMFPQSLEQQLNISSDISFIEQSPYFYNHYNFIYHIDPPYCDVKGGIFYYLDNLVPPLVKTPLIKTSKGIRYIQTHHRITPAKIAPITSAVLHFKFLGNFYERSKNIVSKKLLWGGGKAYSSYIRMHDNHIKQEAFDFTKLDKTIKYENSQQLVELDLIKTSPEWNDFTNINQSNLLKP